MERDTHPEVEAVMPREPTRTMVDAAFRGEGKMSDTDIAEDRGLPWRVAPWGDGSTPTGHANIISDKWGVVIASELLTETAEFIVATANMAPEVERLRAGRAAVWAECRETCAKEADRFVRARHGALAVDIRDAIRALEVPNE